MHTKWLFWISALSVGGFAQESIPETPPNTPIVSTPVIATEPSVSTEPIQNTETTPAICSKNAPSPVRISARHLELKGIGYNQGYSTLEAFFSPYEPINNHWIPLIDLRGHVFNNGYLAANAGLGLRYLPASWNRIFGFYGFYDYRNTPRHAYHQASVGLESLGRVWDFRVNGYLPFGSKMTHFYGMKFDHFEGNSIIQRREKEFAFKGLNAEAGLHVQAKENIPLYFTAGPYYLTGKKTTWGGELRAIVDFGDYVSLQASTSYDSIFKWIGQGEIRLTLPLGRTREIKETPNRSCAAAYMMSQRAVQRIDRHEIIPVDHRVFKDPAIDPDTGLPYHVIFVDNQGQSNGTFESPYHDLTTAQANSSAGDIIYIMPGDGSPYDKSDSFTMKTSQHLWGSGVEQSLSTTWGTTTIPATSATYPIITASTADRIVTLANACEVSGLQLNYSSSNHNAILGLPITDTLIQKNKIEFESGSLADYIYGINILNIDGLGNYSILNNSIKIINNFGTFGIYASSSASADNNSTWTINQNIIQGEIAFGSNGINNHSVISINQNNVIATSDVVEMTIYGTNTNTVTQISDNTLSSPDGGGIFWTVEPNTTTANDQLVIQNNDITANNFGIDIPTDGIANTYTTITIEGNSIIFSILPGSAGILNNIIGGNTIDGSTWMINQNDIQGATGIALSSIAEVNNSTWTVNQNHLIETSQQSELGWDSINPGNVYLQLIDNLSTFPIKLEVGDMASLHVTKSGNVPPPVGP